MNDPRRNFDLEDDEEEILKACLGKLDPKAWTVEDINFEAGKHPHCVGTEQQAQSSVASVKDWVSCCEVSQGPAKPKEGSWKAAQHNPVRELKKRGAETLKALLDLQYLRESTEPQVEDQPQKKRSRQSSRYPVKVIAGVEQWQSAVAEHLEP